MTDPDEESRAALWCQQRATECAARVAREAKLAGNAAARTQLDADWEPVLAFRLEQRTAGGREGDECR